MGRRPVVSILAFNLAMLLAIASALISVVTIVPDVEERMLWTACGCGSGAIVLVAASWLRMPRGGRPLAVCVAVVALVGLGLSLERLVRLG